MRVFVVPLSRVTRDRGTDFGNERVFIRFSSMDSGDHSVLPRKKANLTIGGGKGWMIH